jgi:hypothetical protein
MEEKAGMSGSAGPASDRTWTESSDPGCFVDLDAAARDAALQPLVVNDPPIRRADDLVVAVAGGALKATVAARVEQIVKFGHTIDTDLNLPIPFLASETLGKLQAARDVMLPGERRNLRCAKRRVAAVAGMCWALLDCLDVLIAKEGDLK